MRARVLSIKSNSHESKGIIQSTSIPKNRACQMDYLKEFPLEFSKPFAICFELLAKANISLHDEKRSIQRNTRSLLLLVCYVTFYASLVISFAKVFTGELGFYELANLLPIFIVATQGTYA